MSITFTSDGECRLWCRLLELDGERCFERARRRGLRPRRTKPCMPRSGGETPRLDARS